MRSEPGGSGHRDVPGRKGPRQLLAFRIIPARAAGLGQRHSLVCVWHAEPGFYMAFASRARSRFLFLKFFALGTVYLSLIFPSLVAGWAGRDDRDSDGNVYLCRSLSHVEARCSLTPG